ncbi:MAG: hypothetical protein COB17_02280 [Sulfurimonas sp.]|nr:MAG: hypothetical protein COB17_02280 [Sulfurimonas sp.]
MKSVFTFLILSISLFASPLQKVSMSFSSSEKDLLLKEFLHSSSTLHTSNSYSLQKGWNKVNTPKNGLDTIKTFKKISKVKFVVTYDKFSKLWAMYTIDTIYPKDNILFLKYLEPNITFFILATEDVEVQIKSKTISSACKKIMQNPKFDFLTDSGINKQATTSENKSISITSRYYSHNEIGVYDDTRVLLIYPKLKHTTKSSYKYGPGKPKVKLTFSKEYENKKFYIYDYKKQTCNIGMFPSLKIPPFPILREVK